MGFIRWIVLFATVTFMMIGCEAENANDVSCFAPDCDAACLAIGYSDGTCTADTCQCAGGTIDPYEWVPDAGHGIDAGGSEATPK